MRTEAATVLDDFRQGGVDAFETLFRQHRRPVYGWILRLVRDPAAAEDLTVETFWRIYRAHARFDPRRGFEGWARRVATRAALDWLRTARPAVDAAPLEEIPAPPQPDAAVNAEIHARTAQAFARLPAGLRIAATLAVVEGQAHKDVAEALGISVGAVKLRVFRALRLLLIRHETTA